MKVIVNCASEFEETNLPDNFVKAFDAHIEHVDFKASTGLINKIKVYVAEVESFSELIEKAEMCGKELYIIRNTKKDFGFNLPEITIVDGHL